ncbi:hypothetical protein [Pseudoclavibacter terrae]|uniref:Lipoprotein n=1 Tax=Pseudoclavibacter terrae TaxID=1530195 RepID=A0A7J5B3U3_9MICO|nr:hypothetical protein [Pseudoclavibacter terrae]KAB1638839.1 hypothetical protein F8O03_00295 [Pseudoclavibacter terrae]
MKRTRRAAMLVCAGVAVTLGLLGCSGTDQGGVTGGEVAGSMLGQIISDGLTNAKSETQREVLAKAQETGVISESDWKEANARYAECMNDKGYNAEIVYEGADAFLQTEEAAGQGDDQGAAPDGAVQEDGHECYDKTSAFINEAYSLINGGQSAVSPEEMQRAVLQCLIDRELVPADTTYEEFVADLEQNDGKQYSPQSTEEGDPFAACWMENS